MLCLKPGGLLFIGVPTAAVDNVWSVAGWRDITSRQYPQHRHTTLTLPRHAPTCDRFPYQRIYGPYRLLALIEGYELIGRVWNGAVVSFPNGEGKTEAAMQRDPKVFTTPKEVMDWQVCSASTPGCRLNCPSQQDPNQLFHVP